MAGWAFPHDVLSGYFLDSITHQSADDEDYFLCIGRDMKLFCLIHYMPNKSYGVASWSERIEPEAFQNHVIEGMRLDELVEQRLRQLFPNE